jgi:hypothetical protein
MLSNNACCHSFQNVLSSYLLAKNIWIKINTNKFACFLYGCKASFLMLREEHRLRVFEYSVLSKIFGPKKEAVIGYWRK